MDIQELPENAEANADVSALAEVQKLGDEDPKETIARLASELKSIRAVNTALATQLQERIGTLNLTRQEVEQRGKLLEEQRVLLEHKDEEIANLHTTVAAMQREEVRTAKMIADCEMRYADSERRHRETLQIMANDAKMLAGVEHTLRSLEERHQEVRRDNQALINENNDLWVANMKRYVFRRPKRHETDRLMRVYANQRRQQPAA